MLTPLFMSVKLKGNLYFCRYYNELNIEFVSPCFLQALRLKYEELKKSMAALTKSSVDNLLQKIHHRASRPVPEFNRFEALVLLEALKNAAQDTKHEKAGYYRLTFDTVRGKIDEPNDQFRNFLLPLLGNKDQEKVLEVVTKVEKNNR